MTNGNEEAFGHGAIGPDGTGSHCPGLTKREYFAAMAMQGLIASTLPVSDISEEMYHGIPIMAVFTADKLIEALNK